MTFKAKALLSLAALALFLQFYPSVERTNPPVLAEMPAPPDVRRVLERSCYDCHSNATRWPWYGYVAPTSWLLRADVREARARLNFSNWPQGTPPEVACFFKRRIAERVGKGEMPPLRYRLLHPSAEVTEEESALLSDWSTERCADLD